MEDKADRFAWWFCLAMAIGGFVIYLFWAASVPAQELTPAQLKAKADTAKVGALLAKHGNTETYKAANGKLTSKIYASPQWDKQGNPLLRYDQNEKIVIAKNSWVRFTPDAATEALPVQRVIGNASIKEYYTVPSAATNTLSWTVQTNATSAAWTDNGLAFYDGDSLIVVSPPPVAWDADNKPVTIGAAFNGKVLTYAIGGEYRYPVVVDPSVNVTATNDGKVYAFNETYLTERNATTGTAASTDIAVGQYWAGSGNYQTRRGYAQFDLTSAVPTGNTVTAVSLFLNGADDGSTVDFDYYVIEGTQSGALATGTYNDFTGWAASGEYTGVVKYTAAYNSSTYSVNWNEYVYNATGIAAVTADLGGTHAIAIVSQEDITASEPTDSEALQFDASADVGTEPYLAITYAAPSTGLTRSVPYDKQPNYLWDNGEPVPIIKP